MDFLDPRKERRNRLILLLTYGLVATAISGALYVMHYHFDGYAVDRAGQVTRNGFVFLSTQPEGATIQLGTETLKAKTNTRLDLEEGTHSVRLSAPGYRDWRRTIQVMGGDVQRFDYPLLFPRKLQTTSLRDFSGHIILASQSPDKRWLLLQEKLQTSAFWLYDLRDQPQPTQTELVVPPEVFTAAENSSWQSIEWSSDNRHVLLKRTSTNLGQTQQEYLMLDRASPDLSRNLTKELSLGQADVVTLFNKKFNQYYLHNTETKTLRTVALPGDTVADIQLSRVLAYKTYADSAVLYVTDETLSQKLSATNMVSVRLRQDGEERVLREVPAGAENYVLDMARYDGNWYVVAGSSLQKGVHVYKNPFSQPLGSIGAQSVPLRFIRLAEPRKVSFSANARFILLHNGENCAVFDVENIEHHYFRLPRPLDGGSQELAWMDGFRLRYVSGGSLTVVDYDATNLQTLQPVSSRLEKASFFSGDYTDVYSVVDGSETTSRLTRTPLRIK